MPTARLAPLLVLFALCPDSEARGDLQIAQLQGTVKNAGTYRLATGDWQRRPSVFGIQGQGALYRNDFFAAYAGLLDESEVLFDEGRLPGAPPQAATAKPRPVPWRKRLRG